MSNASAMNPRLNKYKPGKVQMTENVFWISKHWSHQWDIDGIQYLVDNAKSAGERPTVFELLTDGDPVLAIGPENMRNDEDTGDLLSSNYLPIPGTDVSVSIAFHWDGKQFWAAPMVGELVLRKLQRAPYSEIKMKVLSQIGKWMSEEEYLELYYNAIEE